MRVIHRIGLGLAVAALTLAQPAHAQQHVDFNSDGTPDTVRREVRLHITDPVVSRIVLVSGVDGAGLLSIAPKFTNDLFGWWAAPAGDFDLDGVQDVLVTAPTCLIAEGLPATEPGGPIPDWRGRVDIYSGATGGELLSLFNPEATADCIFGLGAAIVPDQDADNIPDILVGGIRVTATATAENPNAHSMQLRWWVMSSATAEALRFGYGPVGVAGCEFLMPGEHPNQYWASAEMAGVRAILPGIAGDLDGDGDVDNGDATQLIGEWSGGTSHVGDLNQDGTINATDLHILLSQMGFPADADDAFGTATPPTAHSLAPDLKNFFGGGPIGLPECAYMPDGCQYDCIYAFWGSVGCGGQDTNAGTQGPDEGGNGGCPYCPDTGTGPGGCEGPCCNNPCGPGCWNPNCGPDDEVDCNSCTFAWACDFDGDGWVNGQDCDSPCANLNPAECDCTLQPPGSVQPGYFAPDFVGMGQSFNIVVYQGLFHEWDVPAGADLLETWDAQEAFFQAVAKNMPGTVQVRVRYARNGRQCEFTHTIQIVAYEPVTIRYAAFIPCEVVAVPEFFEWSPWYRFFGGDNRDFDSASVRYRSQHEVTLRVTDYSGTQVLSGPNPAFGLTTAYLPTQVGPDLLGSGCEWILHALELPADTATQVATALSHQITVARVNPSSVRIEFHLSGTNSLFPLAPAIDAHFNINLSQTINATTGATASFLHLSGIRDRYPAHELYVIQLSLHVLHQYNPLRPGGSLPPVQPSALAGPQVPIPNVHRRIDH